MPRDDEELAALLADLEETLGELRTELTDERGREATQRGDDRRQSAEDRSRGSSGQIDPPGVRDVIRFTEEYTLPTLIATLEATIEALRLFQRLLSVVTPGDRTTVSEATGQSTLRDVSNQAAEDLTGRAADQLRDRLAELQTALDRTELPQEESRDILTEARELTEEIERQVRDSRRDVTEERRGSPDSANGNRETDARQPRASEPVQIEVGDPDDTGDDSEAASEEPNAETANEEPPAVDVEAELESIKRELGADDERGADGAGEAADTTPTDGQDGDDADRSEE